MKGYQHCKSVRTSALFKQRFCVDYNYYTLYGDHDDESVIHLTVTDLNGTLCKQLQVHLINVTTSRLVI